MQDIYIPWLGLGRFPARVKDQFPPRGIRCPFEKRGIDRLGLFAVRVGIRASVELVLCPFWGDRSRRDDVGDVDGEELLFALQEETVSG